jgi:hypothetical protein
MLVFYNRSLDFTPVESRFDCNKIRRTVATHVPRSKVSQFAKVSIDNRIPHIIAFTPFHR